jgi:hypothetical protein
MKQRFLDKKKSKTGLLNRDRFYKVWVLIKKVREGITLRCKKSKNKFQNKNNK